VRRSTAASSSSILESWRPNSRANWSGVNSALIDAPVLVPPELFQHQRLGEAPVYLCAIGLPIAQPAAVMTLACEIPLLPSE
jgi:hypothetical protein